MKYDLVVLGGGAAGIFAAIQAKIAFPKSHVVLLEKSGVLLSKVRVSGGGRCNVTHACFDPAKLCTHYPRGTKELIGPFHAFQPNDTIAWFASRGVSLKTESDGRMFPITDSSETIIQALLSAAEELSVQIHLKQHVESIEKLPNGFALQLKDTNVIKTYSLLLATGSHPAGWTFAQQLGHTIQPPVPSLFTFNVPSSELKELSGISVDTVRVYVKGTSLAQTGPLLITHFGFSGPAVLKLSAFGARHFHEKNYQVEIGIDWLPHLTEEQIFNALTSSKAKNPHKLLGTENLFKLPKNLWTCFLKSHGQKRLSHIAAKDLRNIAHRLHEDLYRVEGKTTHKEEFVTCGGVHLKEIDFKHMESKLTPGLFFAGEILDIDGITGGFNFQNAWTTGFLAGRGGAQCAKARCQ